jgi:putative membrane protein
MRRKTSSRFVVRWAICSLGIWLAAALLGTDKISFQNHLSVVIIAGLVLAIVNTLLKPLVVFLSLPAVLLSLGIFMVVINGFMIVVAAKLYHPLQVANFGVAIVAGIIIGLTNFLVTAIIDDNQNNKE